MIDLANVTRRYGDFTAVDDVTVRIDRGEIVGLLGHNGAGKSTVMKMIAGYLEPSAGTIRVDGIDLGAGEAERRAVQQRIGYLPENCPVWPDLTVLDFLEVQAALHGLPAARREAAVARAVQRTALAARAGTPIRNLSRGFRQRVGVAQAILHEPDIVILDEPTNGLDPTQIQEMRSLIRELAEHATVLVSTHILQEVQAVCERVVILRAGRKVVDARIDDLQRGARLQVTLDREPAAVRAVLSALPAVGHVQLDAGGAGRWRYTLEAGEDAAPAVAEALVRAGFALHALEPERRDLEAVFAEVNQGAAAGEFRHAA